MHLLYKIHSRCREIHILYVYLYILYIGYTYILDIYLYLIERDTYFPGTEPQPGGLQPQMR